MIWGYIFTLGSHFIPNLIKGYLEEKGKNHIHFSFGQGTTKKIVEELKDGKYDLAFSSYVEGEDELEFIPVGQEELVLITPKDHPLAQRKKSIFWIQLNMITYILQRTVD